MPTVKRGDPEKGGDQHRRIKKNTFPGTEQQPIQAGQRRNGKSVHGVFAGAVPEVQEFALKDANRALIELKEKKIRGAKVLRIT